MLLLSKFYNIHKGKSIMLLISQNIESYNIKLPENTVFRINMAWCNNLKELENKLNKNKEMKFFIDLPIGRIKPPNNKYTLDEIIPIIKSNSNIQYFAVSNVESRNDLEPFLKKLPDRIIIVPKIESPTAIENIDEICNELKYEKRMIMLDHDDLFSSIIHSNEDEEKFQQYMKKLVDYCENNDISLLRTVGVVFSDDEKRTTQYKK